jgi:hypothetical protein
MKRSLNGTRQVRFAGNAIQFEIADRDLLKAVDVHFARCMGREKNIVSAYQVRADEEMRFSISRDGDTLVSNVKDEQALFHLMQDGLTQLNGASKTELIFHAAALAYQDKAVVLCGKTASGKSSLAAWLTALGLQYMSDEVISFPLEGETLSGFPRSIVLKSGSAFIWERWLKDESSKGFLKFTDNSAWIEPSLLNGNTPQAAAVPCLLIFPRYKPNSPFQTEPLTRAGSLFRLLQNLVNARNFPDYGLATASRLARRVTAYTLTYSDIETASEWILKTIQQS